MVKSFFLFLFNKYNVMQLLDIMIVESVQYAIAPIVIPLVMAAISIGTSVAKGIKARKQEKEALQAMEDYKRKALVNAYENQPWYSERNSKYAKDMISQNLATVGAVATQGGGRLTGLVGDAQRNADLATRKQLAKEDQAFLQQQQLIAGDEVRIRNEYSKREDIDLAGMGNMASVANQNQQLAWSQGMQGLGTAAAYGYDALKNQTHGTTNMAEGQSESIGLDDFEIPTNLEQPPLGTLPQ